ncbi:MAG: S49 family peptidase, partial [Candidatus Marinimicrobia bacterium]|nr:S49 family peptidase [Candidatus Neomarinimicrobiota bacterium]
MDAQRIGPRPPQRTNRWVWITLATIVTIFLILRIVNLSSDKDGFGSKDKVGIVRVEGPIFTSKTVVEDLESLAQRKDIKAIVLRVNSPGGSIAPSQEIFEKVRGVREIKPIITSMGSVAASGGYYIALGSTSVMANKGTITGSIGVIMEYPVATELLEKLGLSIETVKSGQLKD